MFCNEVLRRNTQSLLTASKQLEPWGVRKRGEQGRGGPSGTSILAYRQGHQGGRAAVPALSPRPPLTPKNREEAPPNKSSRPAGFRAALEVILTCSLVVGGVFSPPLFRYSPTSKWMSRTRNVNVTVSAPKNSSLRPLILGAITVRNPRAAVPGFSHRQGARDVLDPPHPALEGSPLRPPRGRVSGRAPTAPDVPGRAAPAPPHRASPRLSGPHLPSPPPPGLRALTHPL